MEQVFKKGAVLHLASLIDYSEGGVISKQLIKVRQETSLYFLSTGAKDSANTVHRSTHLCRYWKERRILP